IAGAFHEAVRGELFGEDPLGRRGVAANVEVELDVLFVFFL
ncbi:hypothetical protein Tsubulata_048886, partial [Turnera subulata]